MKILIVTQYYYPENFVISKIAMKLFQYGHYVEVLTGKPNYGYGYILPSYKNITEEVIDGVKVNRVNLLARKKSRASIIANYLSFWFNSKKWIRQCKTKFDVVYSMSLSPVTILAAGNLYKKKYHVPHIVHCVDLWPESVLITHAVKEKSLVYRFLYNWSHSLYSRADTILIGSKSFELYFQNILKIANKTVKYIPQPSFIEHNDSEPFNYDNSYLNVLYCGNLGLIQLIPMITDAMRLVRDVKIKFHIIGMGPMTDKLIKDINRYNLNETVIYYGPMPAEKASAFFKSADALYVSLKQDGYVGKTIPNKLVMSMAFAKPIIAMIQGDGKDVIEEAKGGLIADEDASSLAEKLKEFLAISKEDRLIMGQKNLDYYQKHFSLDYVAKQIESELMNKIL